ncbi:MAG TPA: hypothetical protein VGR25_09345 [bacterium]|jgi:hypothetical protein|nr:hypothetical protein [bacterium]
MHKRIRPAMAAAALLLLHLVWLSVPSPVVGAARQEFRAAKGFVVARTPTSLTLLAGERRILATITPETRVLGQRQRVSGVVLNDVVRAEGRWTAGDHLLADRVEVVIAAGSLALRRPLVTPTLELIGFGN